MKRASKTFATLISTLTLSALMAACGGNEPNQEQEPSSENTKNDNTNDENSNTDADDSNTEHSDLVDTNTDDTNTDDTNTDDTNTDDTNTDDSNTESPAICPDGFTGENCDKCVDNRFTGPECDICLDGATDSMQDDAGNDYKTICINKQFWMAQNMNYEFGEYTHANKDSGNDEIYGLLYNWETAKQLCPEGWHLPTRDEFNSLLSYVDKNRTSENRFLALMANSEAWKNYSKQGGDDFSFTALPAGWCNSSTNCNYFLSDARWWSSTEKNETESYYMYMSDTSGTANVNCHNSTLMLSVRCIKD